MHGKIDSEDQLVDTTVASSGLAETYEGGRHRFDGDVVLDHSGAFGYTVRVIPRNELLDLAPPSWASSRWLEASVVVEPRVSRSPVVEP